LVDVSPTICRHADRNWPAVALFRSPVQIAQLFWEMEAKGEANAVVGMMILGRQGARCALAVRRKELHR